jgi:hypothetical protein
MDRSSIGAMGMDAQEDKARTDKMHAKQCMILFMIFPLSSNSGPSMHATVWRSA